MSLIDGEEFDYLGTNEDAKAGDLELIAEALSELMDKAKEIVDGTNEEDYFKGYILGNFDSDRYGFLGKGVMDSFREVITRLENDGMEPAE